jgi:hypothetical protein
MPSLPSKRTSTLIGFLAALAAAGSATAATPTKTSWATSANTACRTANAQIRRLPKVTSNQVFVADLRATVRIGASMNAKLAAIPRPASERKAIGSLLAITVAQQRLFAEMIPAVQQGDQATMSRLATKGDKLNTQYNRLALALGAHVCAENPQPSG